MDWTDEVSRLAKSGESMTCMTMAGTPPKTVIRSRSMSSRARSGSKWCIITNLPPAAVLVTSSAWQPVAWNSGTDSRLAFWTPGDASFWAWVRRMPPTVETKNRFMRLEQLLRWVPTAPFGRPVVPEV